MKNSFLLFVTMILSFTGVAQETVNIEADSLEVFVYGKHSKSENRSDTTTELQLSENESDFGGLEDSDIQIAPNPAVSILNIRVPESYTGSSFWITNTYGQVVFTGAITASLNMLDVTIFDAGVYYLNIEGSNDILRFIKE